MNFIKRAMLAVTRRKGKSLIMLVIFATIANLVIAGFAIQNATDYASELARQKLGGKLTLRFDNQKVMETARSEGMKMGMGRFQTEPIPEDMAQPLIQHENIIGYNYIVNTMGMAEGFEPVVTVEEEDSEESTSGNTDQGLRGVSQGFIMPDVTIVGTAVSDLLDEFNSEAATLLEGRHIDFNDSEGKVAIIEKNLAAENDLKIGDTISIGAMEADEAIDLQIVGIYESNEEVATGGMGMRQMTFTEPYNRIYVDYPTAMALKFESSTADTQVTGIDSAVFFVDDPKNIDQVKTDAEGMAIDWDKYILDANDQAYQQMMGPIENVSSFSITVVYIIAVAGAVILALLLTLSIKERMYETGVLLSMGEGKLKVLGQYVAEVLIIAVIAFSVSIFSGSVIAQDIGDSLLEREIQVVQEQGLDGGQIGGNSRIGGGQYGRLLQQRYQLGNQGDIEPINSFDIDVTLTEIMKMSLVGLLVIIFGTILPAVTVMRYNPKTILTKAT
ncbi:ABC transporter permease [Alkaliphilus hydrothermalis]|uniref:ABC transporter permease n=1 Tax=Alkaliphilus hydrothermalis TaxID=1482730 RepID=UPI00195D0A63